MVLFIIVILIALIARVIWNGTRTKLKYEKEKYLLDQYLYLLDSND